MAQLYTRYGAFISATGASPQAVRVGGLVTAARAAIVAAVGIDQDRQSRPSRA